MRFLEAFWTDAVRVESNALPRLLANIISCRGDAVAFPYENIHRPVGFYLCLISVEQRQVREIM